MKLLVFAHTPPPHHGQSYMVRLMLDGFGGDHRRNARPAEASRHGITCYHVNARLSRNLEDIGEFRPQKVLLLLSYCLQAIWCRFRYGATTLYYIPSPGKRSALIRDWMVMRLCRPFFKKVILHWHAAGLGKWLETVALRRTRSTTYRLLKAVDLSIVLSKYNWADAEKLWPRRIRVVSNGIPDPCPQFDQEILPRRQARVAARRKLLRGEALLPQDLADTGGDPGTVAVLYLAHCTREKGVFDAVAAVMLANRELAARRSPLRLKLRVAGTFVDPAEQVEFDRLVADPERREQVFYLGFVTAERKHRALADADLFCFPTYFSNENQPVNLIEALAYGLPVVTTRWRSVPEILPAGHPGLVEPRQPEQMASALLQVLDQEDAAALRQHFVSHFTLEQHLANLAAALRSVEDAERDAVPPSAGARG